MSENNERRPRHLPVMYRGADGQEIAGRSLVAVPSPDDVDLYGAGAARATCASCRHFRHEQGQKAMAEERFLERLVIEEQWKVRHLGCSPRDYGYCQERGSEALTSMHAPACDHYHERRGRL